MIHATSRASLAQLQTELGEALGSLDSASLIQVADDLHAVSLLLAAQPQLRRALGDGSTPPPARSALIARVLGSQVRPTSISVAQQISALRWSNPWDLTDAFELASDEVLLKAAEKNGRLDDVEDQLFRFERILASESSLVALLDDASVPAARRNELLRTLLGAKVDPSTLRLLENAVASSRKRSLTLAIDDLLEVAARLQDRSIAKVTSAAGLSAEQEQRLVALLSQMYGRAISLRVAIDPQLRGGLIVRIGDEVIDGSISSRIAALRSGLVTN